MHRGRAHELQSLWQPFWPVKSTFRSPLFQSGQEIPSSASQERFVTWAQFSSGTVPLDPNSTARSSVYRVNFSKACRTAGARWELCPEPGLPSSSSLGRQEVGSLRTLLHNEIWQSHWIPDTAKAGMFWLGFYWGLRLNSVSWQIPEKI